MSFNCPDRGELLNFASGRLPSSRFEQIARHVEHCAHCQAILDRESPEPTWKRWLGSRGISSQQAGRAVTGESDASVPVELPCGFTWLGMLGGGGMGVVYRVRDEQIQRDVAIKVIRPEVASDQRVVQRFLAEACITGQLQHPGIPPVYQVGKLADGRPYFAMKLVKGHTLHQLLAARRHVHEDQAAYLDIFERVCQAVSYAHERRVIHRDLKPGNVMVGAFGEVQVMDWGLAKVLEEAELSSPADDLSLADTRLAVTSIDTPVFDAWQTRPGSALGTAAFMAPEQAGGELSLLGRQTDVFGLGAILCVILTGEPPYRGSSGHQLRLKAVRADLADAWQRLEQCGAQPELVSLAKRCLSASPEERPRHAGEVAEAVAHFRREVQERARRAEQARAAAEVQAAEQRKRRRVWRLAATLLFGAALVALALAVWATHARRRATEAQQRADQERQEAVAQRTRAVNALHGEQQARQAAVAARQRAELHRREALQTLSTYQADRGCRALQGGDAYGLLDLADACQTVSEFPELHLRRAALWAPWHAALGGQLLAQRPHRDSARRAVFLKDGMVASGGLDGLIRIWSSATNEQITRPLDCGPGCTVLAASADGNLLAAGVWGANHVRLWQTRSWMATGTVLQHQDSIFALAWSPDNRHLLTGSDDGTAVLWDAKTGLAVLPPIKLEGWIRCVAVSPADRWMAAGSDEGTLAIRARSGATAQPVLRKFSSAINAVAFVNDELLVVGCDDGQLELVKVPNAQTVKHLSQADRIETIAVAPGGKEVAVGVHHTVLRWNPVSEHVVGYALPHVDGISQMSYSPDGRQLVTASFDGMARVWQCHPFPPAPIRQMETPDECWCLAWQPNAEGLWVGTQQGRVVRWLWQTGEVAALLPDRVNAVLALAIAPDGTRVATASSSEAGRDIRLLPGVVQLWSTADGGVDGRPISFNKLSWAVDFSADGKWFAAAAWSHDARIFQRETMQETYRITRHDGPPMSVAFNHAGTLVAVGTGVGTVTLWSLSDGKQYGPTLKHRGALPCLAFSPDDRWLAAASWQQAVYLWDVQQGRLAVPPLAHPQQVRSVAFHPAGHWLASGGDDGVVRLWEPSTGLPAGPVLPVGARVHAVAFSSDGRYLAAAVAIDASAEKRNRGRVVIWQLPDVPIHDRDIQTQTRTSLGVRRNSLGAIEPAR